jgi:hypothetical protein
VDVLHHFHDDRLSWCDRLSLGRRRAGIARTRQRNRDNYRQAYSPGAMVQVRSGELVRGSAVAQRADLPRSATTQPCYRFARSCYIDMCAVAMYEGDDGGMSNE